ncbi:hypothetical protein [Streptococcus phage SG005]|nr:hypothetical protein [Streptococcus phage SG005]
MVQEFTRNVKNVKPSQETNHIEFMDVNDLLSNNKDNFIKRPNEQLHCLTDNIKTVVSSNQLLTVLSDKENNKVNLTVNSDPTKEDRLKSTDNSIIINRASGQTDLLVNKKRVIFTNNSESLVTVIDYCLQIIQVFSIGQITYAPNTTTPQTFTTSTVFNPVNISTASLDIIGNTIKFKEVNTIPVNTTYGINGWVINIDTQPKPSRPAAPMQPPQ